MEIVQGHSEQERLDALEALKIMHSGQLPEYDAVVEAVAAVFDCPIALISLVGEDSQWFKAKCGLDVEGTPRSVSFCQHAILSDDLLVVPDALEDERFRSNPLVTGEPHIRFYAGCPISIDGKNRLGTLCVIDRKPKTPSEHELNQLRRFGTIVEGLLKAHRSNLEAEAACVQAEQERHSAQIERELLSEIANLSGVGGWELNVATNELIWTEKTREIHELEPGFTPTVELALSYYAPDSRPKITEAVQTAIEAGTGWDLELPFITAKGRDIWVRAAGRPIIEDDKVVRLVGAFRDITERKKSEQEIRHSAAVHRTILEAMSEGILLVNRAGMIQSHNAAAADLLGIPEKTLKGGKIQDLEFDYQCQMYGAISCCDPFKLAATEPEKIRDFTVCITRPNNTGKAWLRINAKSICSSDNYGLDGVVISLTDISEIKQQADTLQVIFDNLPGGVVYYDDEQRLSVCNKDFRRLLQLPDRFIDRKAKIPEVARFLADRGDYGDGDPETLFRDRMDILTSKQPHVQERTSPDGTVLEVRGSPLPNGGHVASFFDITNRKRIEEEIRHSETVHRTTLEALYEGVLLLDRAGTIRSCNPAAARMLGYSPDELAGKLPGDLNLSISHSQPDEPRDPFQLAALDPDLVADTVISLVPRGKSSKLWLRLNAKGVDQTGDNYLETVVVSLADITETKTHADQLRVIFENVPGGFAYFDENLQLSFYNEELIDIIEYPRELLEQRLHLLDYLKYNAARGDYGPGDPEMLALQRFKDYPPDRAHTFERETASGRFLDFRSTPLPGGGFIYNFFDVTERKEIERRLAENEKQSRLRSEELEGILANMRQGVSVFDEQGRLTLWNQQYIDIFGKPKGEIRKGVTLTELIEAEKQRGEFDGAPHDHVMDLVTRLMSGETVRSKFKHPNGKVISVAHSPLPGGGWIGTHEDITLSELAAQEIQHAAHHDALTGLANRVLFNARLDEAIGKAIETGKTGELMLLDLDKFKPVNDTFGHDVGDELLKQVAMRLKDCFRSSDLVARLGGDEFGVILSGTGDNPARTAEIADRVVRKLEAPFSVEDLKVSVGVSIGIAAISAENAEASQIIKSADLALYDVKHNGRNGFRFYDPEIQLQAAQA